MLPSSEKKKKKLIRKSMKLFFSELGNIFSKMFTIICKFFPRCSLLSVNWWDFLYIFIYMWKSDNFSTYLNFDKKLFFWYFKSQISKWKHMSELLSVARGLKHSYSLSNKQIKYISSHQSPCTLSRGFQQNVDCWSWKYNKSTTLWGVATLLYMV